MRTITGIRVISGQIVWQSFGDADWHREEGITINFPFSKQTRPRDALHVVTDALQQNGIAWLIRKDSSWVLDLDRLRQQFPDELSSADWAKGTHLVVPEIFDEVPFSKKHLETRVQFVVNKEQAIMSNQDRIFLSHKGVDKPRVRAYKSTLETIGLKPWLDEDAMPAGTSLERGILQGFKDSCAAIFFVTQSFRDAGYLGSEVDYAIAEKRSKGDRFAIITLVFAPAAGATPEVPDLLRPYVWKQPADDLEAFREVLRAIPLELRPAWRSGY